MIAVGLSHRFGVDDLRTAADANRSGRAREARRAEAIVAAEVARCLECARPAGAA